VASEQGRGGLRASDADREQAIEVLKAAFVRDRLAGAEFEARVGQALASRTYAELAAATDGIPGTLTADTPPGMPARVRKQRTQREMSQGDLAEALASHAEGLRLFRAVGDRLGEATGLENVGRVHRLLGRTAAALECQEAALRIVRQLGDRMRQAECLHELGRLRELAGDRGQARVYWRQALAVFSQLRVPEADEVRKLLATDP